MPEDPFGFQPDQTIKQPFLQVKRKPLLIGFGVLVILIILGFIVDIFLNPQVYGITWTMEDSYSLLPPIALISVLILFGIGLIKYGLAFISHLKTSLTSSPSLSEEDYEEDLFDVEEEDNEEDLFDVEEEDFSDYFFTRMPPKQQFDEIRFLVWDIIKSELGVKSADSVDIDRRRIRAVVQGFMDNDKLKTAALIYREQRESTAGDLLEEAEERYFDKHPQKEESPYNFKQFLPDVQEWQLYPTFKKLIFQEIGDKLKVIR